MTHHGAPSAPTTHCTERPHICYTLRACRVGECACRHSRTSDGPPHAHRVANASGSICPSPGRATGAAWGRQEFLEILSEKRCFAPFHFSRIFHGKKVFRLSIVGRKKMEKNPTMVRYRKSHGTVCLQRVVRYRMSTTRGTVPYVYHAWYGTVPYVSNTVLVLVRLSRPIETFLLSQPTSTRRAIAASLPAMSGAARLRHKRRVG